MIQVGFVLEQALGHVTHTQNLQTHVPKDHAVNAHWALIPFAATGLGAHLPVYRSNWTVRAGWRSRRALGALAGRTRLDALLFHTQVTAVLASNWMRRVPSVVSLDATPLQYDALGASYAHARGPDWLESLKWRLNRDCYRDARHLVTWSSWAKRGLVDGYGVPEDKITVIPPGVTTSAWQRPAPRVLHDGAFRILFVGAALGRKGGLVLLDAWRALKADVNRAGQQIELHMVTKDTVAAEPGLFLYHDMQPNSEPLRRLYFDSDVFCLPTYGDCLPMVLSEAGATGLPSISTDVAAIGEITRHNDTGLLVTPGDVGGLASALGAMIDNPERRLAMGERAIQVVAQEYDAERNAGRLLEQLKAIARAPAG